MIELTEEQSMIIDTVRKIAGNHLKHQAAEIDKNQDFSWETVKLFSENGLLTPMLPEKYGGIGAGFLLFSAILEEISKVCASSALILIAQADGMLPILCDGSKALKEKYLPSLTEGKLAAFAATEPCAGSDILSMKTRARRNGNGYVLNGQKCFTTNGSIADIITVYAYTDPDKGPKGITPFVVEKGSDGLSYGKNENKMGMRGSINSELFFDDLYVPEENRIGEEGQGIKNIMATLNTSRLFCAAQAVGLAQGAFDEAISYAKQRIQFGKPISTLQGIQFMMADMAAGIESARLLTYQAATNLDKNDEQRIPKSCAMAKFLASDMAMKVTTDAIQIMGGYGYMKDFPVERMMRDAKLTQIYTGTNQIMRLVTARELLKD